MTSCEQHRLSAWRSLGGHLSSSLVASPIEIGRDCAGVLLTEPALSRRHLALAPHDGAVFVTDLGTTNGSTVDGEPLSPRHRLVVGETVRFGRCTLELAAPVSSEQPRAARVPSVRAREVVDLRATSIDRVADAVLAEQLAAPNELDVGSVTVVFSDIEGPTTRAVELGDTAWMEVLEAFRSHSAPSANRRRKIGRVDAQRLPSSALVGGGRRSSCSADDSIRAPCAPVGSRWWVWVRFALTNR